jgi:hypothetical protein
MPTLANSTADETVRPEVSVRDTTRASSIDIFITGRVRIRRTSRGLTQRDLSELLGIDCGDLVH